MTVTSIEDLTELDWEHQPPCEEENHEPARWRATFVCGCVFLCCDRCAKLLRDEAGIDPTRTIFYMCQRTGWRGACRQDQFVTLKPLS